MEPITLTGLQIAFRQQQLDIAREIGDLFGQAISLHNLAEAYLNNTEQSLDYCERSLTIMKKIQLSYIDLCELCEELKQKILAVMNNEF